nr:hypothetical protein [Tanacetum cinerariifolium]
MTQATIQSGQITTESVQRRALGNKEAEAFLADVEPTAHYDDSLAITTTTSFEVSHEDAYDFDVDEEPHATAAFMANLTGTSTEEGTSNDTDFHSKKPTGRKFTLGDTCPLSRITKPEVVSLENSGSVRASKPTNNVTVTPRFSEKTLTSYKRKDRNTKDTSTSSPSNIETMAAKYPVIVYPLPV